MMADSSWASANFMARYKPSLVRYDKIPPFGAIFGAIANFGAEGGLYRAKCRDFWRIYSWMTS